MIKIERFFEEILRFIYGAISVFVVCLMRPSKGTTIVFRNRKRYPRPVTTLLLASALVALSSIAGPSILPNLVARSERPITFFAVYLIVVYFVFDTALIAGASISSIFNKRSMHLSVGLMRYAAAGLLVVASINAMVHILYQVAQTENRNSVVTLYLVHLFEKPVIKFILYVLAFLPMIFTIVRLTRQPRLHLAGMVAMAAVFLILGFSVFIVNYSNQIAYPVATYLLPEELPVIYGMTKSSLKSAANNKREVDTKTKSSEMFFGDSEKNAKIRLDPMICNFSKKGIMHVQVAMHNDSENGLALDLSNVYALMWDKNSNLLKPKAHKINFAFSGQRLLVIPAKSTKLISGKADFSKVFNFIDKASPCSFSYLDYNGNERFELHRTRNESDAQILKSKR